MKKYHTLRKTREADYGFGPQSGNLLTENACIEETLEKHKIMAEVTK